jgi:hypothetical protein
MGATTPHTGVIATPPPHRDQTTRPRKVVSPSRLAGKAVPDARATDRGCAAQSFYRPVAVRAEPGIHASSDTDREAPMRAARSGRRPPDRLATFRPNRRVMRPCGTESTFIFGPEFPCEEADKSDYD